MFTEGNIFCEYHYIFVDYQRNIKKDSKICSKNVLLLHYSGNILVFVNVLFLLAVTSSFKYVSLRTL